MDPEVAIPTTCKVHGVIRFLQGEGHKAVEINRRLCRVYGDKIVSDSSVKD